MKTILLLTIAMGLTACGEVPKDNNGTPIVEVVEYICDLSQQDTRPTYEDYEACQELMLTQGEQ